MSGVTQRGASATLACSLHFLLLKEVTFAVQKRHNCLCEMLFKLPFCIGENCRNLKVSIPVLLNIFCWRRTWDHLYSSVKEICTYNHEKEPKSEGLSLTATSIYCSSVISVSDYVGNCLQIPFCSLFLDHILMFRGTITGCRTLILPILWLKVWPTVLQINCASNTCWAANQVWAWAAGSQPGLLPTGTEHGDGEEQEGDAFWGVLLELQWQPRSGHLHKQVA